MDIDAWFDGSNWRTLRHVHWRHYGKSRPTQNWRRQ